MMETYFDIHTHILPGMDDGAENMETARQMLRQAKENNVEDIVVTSHYCPERWLWDREKYLDRFQALQAEAEKEKIRLYPGNEIYYTSHIPEALEKGACLSLNGGRYILIEFDYHIWEGAMEQALVSLQYEGYTPVIAHAERYRCLTESDQLIQRLSEQGMVIQVNSDSVIEAHRRRLRRSPVKRWLRQKIIHAVASDSHDARLRPNRMRECGAILEKYYGTDYARALLRENPERIVRSRYLGED